MNAIIGDNGIITRAQEANIQSSIASLEEYLQLKYTENYEEMAGYQSKIEGLTNVCSDYFYIPVNEKIGGLRYVIDSEGHALYLIKKSGLPEEIRESLVGGDAGEGSYTDYQNLNDVYGVTSNLKVYYCSGGADSIKGLAKESLDNDNPLRVVFDEDSIMAKFLQSYDKNNDGAINVEETKYIDEIEVNNDSGIDSFENFYNLITLRKLTLNAVNLNNLDGLENCSQLNYLCFINYGNSQAKILNYSGLSKLTKLEYLYMERSDGSQVNEVLGAMKNIDYLNLQYLGIRYGGTSITDISVLNNLTDFTKQKVKYLYLNNNNISSISCLEDFSSIVELNVENNGSLNSLSGVKNMRNIGKLDASECNLGENEKYNKELENQGKNIETDSLTWLSDKTNLSYVDLANNSNLKWVGYLSNCLEIGTLFLGRL